VQSAFRYDNPLKDVQVAIAKLEAELPKTPVPTLSSAKQERLVAITERSAKLYRATIKQIAADMQPYFKAVPKRRDRRQHIGLLAYARSMGEQTLPRAITFTASFYSIGVPPEFIAFGRSLRQLSSADLKLLREVYPNIANDMSVAGRYLNRDNLAKLAAHNSAWGQIQEDITAIEQILDVSLQPETDDQKKHQRLSSQLLAAKPSEYSELITKLAVCRKSLG
jgi:phosphoenolpyruvate carboxylase